VDQFALLEGWYWRRGYEFGVMVGQTDAIAQ